MPWPMAKLGIDEPGVAGVHASSLEEHKAAP